MRAVLISRQQQGMYVMVTILLMGTTYFLASQPRDPECVASVARIRDTIIRAIREEKHRKNAATSHLPTIYIITPTYKRTEQIPELTRLAQTLMNVPQIHWIVAEDSRKNNEKVIAYLKHTGLPHTYLRAPMPQEYRNLTMEPKGVSNRNAGLDWVRLHATDGVVYFADDDNTYDLRVFEEMRYTKQVSMWPVGCIKYSGVSSPVLRDGKLVGWYDGWIGGRKFPVDMAGFAVSVDYLLKHPEANMPFKPGHEEDGYLRSLEIKASDIEFKAADCTQIYVWHTRTKKSPPFSRDILSRWYDNTNLRVLQKELKLLPA